MAELRRNADVSALPFERAQSTGEIRGYFCVGIRIHRIEKLFLDQPLVFRYGSLSPAKISLQITVLLSFTRQSSVFRPIPDSQLFSECLAPCRSASRSCGYCWYQNSVSRKCQHVPTIFRLRAAKQRRHRRACEPACNLLGVTVGVDGGIARSFREPRLREARSAPLLALAGAQRKSSRFLSERSTSSSYSTTMSSPGSPSPSGASPLA